MKPSREPSSNLELRLPTADGDYVSLYGERPHSSRRFVDRSVAQSCLSLIVIIRLDAWNIHMLYMTYL